MSCRLFELKLPSVVILKSFIPGRLLIAGMKPVDARCSRWCFPLLPVQFRPIVDSTASAPQDLGPSRSSRIPQEDAESRRYGWARRATADPASCARKEAISMSYPSVVQRSAEKEGHGSCRSRAVEYQRNPRSNAEVVPRLRGIKFLTSATLEAKGHHVLRGHI